MIKDSPLRVGAAFPSSTDGNIPPGDAEKPLAVLSGSEQQQEQHQGRRMSSGSGKQII